MFEKFGVIRSCKTVKKELYQSYLGIKRSVKVSGFVCFEQKEDAKKAKDELNGSTVFNTQSKLFVDFHQSKSDRSEFLKIKVINGVGAGLPFKQNAPVSFDLAGSTLFKGFRGIESIIYILIFKTNFSVLTC